MIPSRSHLAAIVATLAFEGAAANTYHLNPERPRHPSEPVGISVQVVNASTVILRWTTKKEEIRFSKYFVLEQTLNGVRVLPPPPGFHFTKEPAEIPRSIHRIDFSSLAADSEHCFRIYTRWDGENVQSWRATDWACGRTPPNPKMGARPKLPPATRSDSLSDRPNGGPAPAGAGVPSLSQRPKESPATAAPQAPNTPRSLDVPSGLKPKP